MIWNSTKNKLPEELQTAFDEDGEIDIEKPYLGIFFTLEEYEETDYEGGHFEEADNMDIVYYYGNNNWKDNRWNKIYVTHWLEIPPLK
jgi:hypothetical protein